MNITYDINDKTTKHACLAEILKSVDKKREQLNLFNSKEKDNFIRKMQLENRIIPITWDFAGSKAEKIFLDISKENNLTVSAFYVSTAEWWLFKDEKYNSRVENVACLPINNKSVILRQNLQMINGRHGNGFRMQYIDDFLKSNNNSGINQYHDLLNLEYLN